jgi:drug/metabolite transporter (DMT)-like permease
VTIAQLALLVGFAFSLASGQILFKAAADKMRVSSGGLVALVSVELLSALALYAGATVLWIFILTRVPLSRAYPFALLGAVIVPVAAHFLFGEKISSTYPLGFVMILMGLWLCVR